MRAHTGSVLSAGAGSRAAVWSATSSIGIRKLGPPRRARGRRSHVATQTSRGARKRRNFDRACAKLDGGRRGRRAGRCGRPQEVAQTARQEGRRAIRVRRRRSRAPLKGDAERADVTVAKRFNQQKSVQVKNLEFSLDWIFDTDGQQEDVYEIAGGDRVGGGARGLQLDAAVLRPARVGQDAHDVRAGRPYSTTLRTATARGGASCRARPQLFAGIEEGSVDSNYADRRAPTSRCTTTASTTCSAASRTARCADAEVDHRRPASVRSSPPPPR